MGLEEGRGRSFTGLGVTAEAGLQGRDRCPRAGGLGLQTSCPGGGWRASKGNKVRLKKASQAPCKQGHELGQPDTGPARLPRHICAVTLAKSALWACFLAERLGFGSDAL